MRAARKRGAGWHVPVSAYFEKNESGGFDLGPPHDDTRGWLIRLADAVGTASDDFAKTQLRHVIQMMGQNEAEPGKGLNAMPASVEAVRPENEVEGALAVQMAAVHRLAMQCLSKAATGSTMEQRDSAGNIATKMLRTYTTQLEALAKLRRGGEQKVVVEHVHVYSGGQAIVGNVEHRGGGGRIENGQQAHALAGTAALAFSPDGSVLRDDTERAGVSGAGGEGQGAVPDARRRQG